MLFQTQHKTNSSKDKPRITITRAPTIDQSSLEYLYPLPGPTSSASSTSAQPHNTMATCKGLVNGEVIVHISASVCSSVATAAAAAVGNIENNNDVSGASSHIGEGLAKAFAPSPEKTSAGEAMAMSVRQFL